MMAQVLLVKRSRGRYIGRDVWVFRRVLQETHVSQTRGNAAQSISSCSVTVGRRRTCMLCVLCQLCDLTLVKLGPPLRIPIFKAIVIHVYKQQGVE